NVTVSHASTICYSPIHTPTTPLPFLNQPTTLQIYTLSLHDALPICVERPVKAAELFAFTLRVRAGNTDVLTDAEENVRQRTSVFPARTQIGRAVQQECRDRSRMPSSA